MKEDNDLFRSELLHFKAQIFRLESELLFYKSILLQAMDSNNINQILAFAALLNSTQEAYFRSQKLFLSKFAFEENKNSESSSSTTSSSPTNFPNSKDEETDTEAQVANNKTSLSSLLPQRGLVSFDKGNFDAIHQKILVFNSELLVSESTALLSLNKRELESLKSLSKTLSETSRYHSSSITQAELAALVKGLKWPSKKRFPYLDLLRLAVIHPATVEYFVNLPSSEQNLVELALINGEINEGVDGNETNQMFALRTLVNLCNTNAGRSLIIQSMDQLMAALPVISMINNKNFHQALSSLFLNLVVVFTQDVPAAHARETLFGVTLQELSDQRIENEVAYRLLLALGTLMFTDDGILKIAKQHGVASRVRVWQTRGDEQINKLVHDLLHLLQ